MKYRDLINEPIQVGDVFVDDGGIYQSGARYVGTNSNQWAIGSWRRPVKEDNWIAFSERKPTKEDAYHSVNGRVSSYDNSIAVLFYDGSVGIHEIQYAGNGEYWMPLNFVPREPVRIKVDGHEVIPSSDGSIKVGCKTVASKDFEEIIRQRNEAMK